MPKPSHDETTQPEPNAFNADRVLGWHLFDLADAREALAAAVRAGDPARIERSACDLVDKWRRACAARAVLDRQLAALALRAQTAAEAMRMNARIVRESARCALRALPNDAAIGKALAIVCQEAEAVGADRSASAASTPEHNDAQ
jgi:hypothetical protein